MQVDLFSGRKLWYCCSIFIQTKTASSTFSLIKTCTGKLHSSKNCWILIGGVGSHKFYCIVAVKQQQQQFAHLYRNSGRDASRFPSESNTDVTLTLCSLWGLGGSKQSTEQFGDIAADIIVGTVHRSETQRRNVVELCCIEERRFVHQFTQTLQQYHAQYFNSKSTLSPPIDSKLSRKDRARFYVPLDIKWVILKTFFPAKLLAHY